MRRVRRRAALSVAAFALVAVSATLLLARVGQLDGVLHRLEHASTWLVALAVAFEALSFAGYVVLTRLVFSPAAPRISWRVSLDITLAGVVATRLLTAAGVGGIALTAWALRAAGLDGRSAAVRLAAFIAILYAVFFGALVLDGTGLGAGALRGAPVALALVAMAIGVIVIALALGALLVPSNLERRAGSAAQRGGRLARVASRAAPAPAVAREAIGLALGVVRGSPSALVAALAWWGFDIAVLWTTFEMFGAAPAAGTLVLCYFLGQVAQVVPVPGGIGPVEGGMIAAFAACGVPVALAVVAVLSYQAISTWLPVVPGAWGYVRLRRTVTAWRGAA
jgi:uncharacterized membrane protein YbhN (UPF0104 family)